MAVAGKYCPDPPQMEENASWHDYKFEVQAWEEITELEKAKRGPSLYLKLVEKAKSVVRDKLVWQISKLKMVSNKLLMS